VALFRKFRRYDYDLPEWIGETKIGYEMQYKQVYCVFLIDIDQLMEKRQELDCHAA
jgi:hypothetical protein